MAVNAIKKETAKVREIEHQTENIGESILKGHGHMGEHIPNVPNVTRHIPKR